jgi:hypothetical protein
MRTDQRQSGILTAAVLACVWLAYSGPGYYDSLSFYSFLVLVGLLPPLFLGVFDLAMPGPNARYAAGFAVAWYGLNPANASILFDFTRRPIVWSTLGMVAALVLYQWRPGWRKYGIYLLPVAAAACFHRATLAFAPLLFAFALLCEKSGEWRAIPGVFLRCIPGLLVSLLALLTVRAGPVIPGEAPPAGVAQALAAFLPAFSPAGPAGSAGSGAGLLFIVVLGVAVSTAAWRETRGVSFGVWWLLILAVAAPGEPLPAGIGVALAASLALATMVGRLPELVRRWVPVGCAGVLILSGLACGQTIDVLPRSADRARVFRSRDPMDWLRVSALQYNGGRFPESIAAASTALRLKPDSVDAYNNMCVAFAGLKMWDQAIQASQEALKLKPGDPAARENLARAQERKRRGSD